MIIHNGEEYSGTIDDILTSKWSTREVFEDVKCKEPELCIFKNVFDACIMMYNSISRHSKIALHIDVDVDGLGNSYELYRFLELFGISVKTLITNKSKKHGVTEQCVNLVNSSGKVDTLIISDSSCNEVELIKKLKCDVIVIDHHEINHKETSGVCNDGEHKFVVVNSRLDNDTFRYDYEMLNKNGANRFNDVREYKGTPDMSCGVVVYEFLRVFSRLTGVQSILEQSYIKQWAAVTLFTDEINTCNSRNQWYIRSLKGNSEHTLGTITKTMNKYRETPDKSFILYNLAPTFNKAIRADKCVEAVQIVMKRPEDVGQLDECKYLQSDAIYKVVYLNYLIFRADRIKTGKTVEEIVNEFTTLIANSTVPKVKYDGEYIIVDLDKYGISKSYAGVIAGNLCGDTGKNVACYINTEKGVEGSFRGVGRQKYREVFERVSDDMYAQGHEPAFGFKCSLETLKEAMSKTVEIMSSSNELFSAGEINKEDRGEYHIDNMAEFLQQGGIYKIAIGNSRVVSSDEICIKVRTCDLKLKLQKERYAIYEFNGIECMAFEKLNTLYCKIYPEFSNQVKLYIRQIQ